MHGKHFPFIYCSEMSFDVSDFFCLRQIHCIFHVPRNSPGTFLFFTEVILMPDQKILYAPCAGARARRGSCRPQPHGRLRHRQGRKIIAEGWHEHIGGLHAERNAFAHCTEDCTGRSLRHAGAVLPLGRTPPCTDAVIEHRIRRVFVGCLDPNPLVAGKGAQILRDAGIEVETGECEAECRRDQRGVFPLYHPQTPFVVLKYAMTLDGKIAAPHRRQPLGHGRSRAAPRSRNAKPPVRHHGRRRHRARGRSSPHLPHRRRPQSVRIVCDSRARTPLGSQLVQTANEIPTYVAVTGQKHGGARRTGVRILVCGETDGHVDLTDLMQQLGSAGINGILLEGGSSLAFSALKAGIVRRVQAYIAPS